MTSTTPPFQKSLDAVKSFLIFLGSYILAVCDIPALEFPSSSQKSSSKDKDIEGSGNGSRHEIAGLADVFNKEDEEEFDPEVASENLKPILLLFKDPVMEEMFVRTTLLSARIVILRSFSIVALSVVVATWSLYQLLPILLTTIGVLLIIIGLTSWKAGEVYVNIYTGSRRGRLALQLLEVKKGKCKLIQLDGVNLTVLVL